MRPVALAGHAARGSLPRMSGFRLSSFRSPNYLGVRRNARHIAGLLIFAACSGGEAPMPAPTGPVAPPDPVVPPSPTGPVGPLVVGQTYTDKAAYVEYLVGDAPLVLVAPHGGALTPATLPDRTCSACVTVADANTQELTRAVADTFFARTGKRPHIVINRLHRRKFDANRDVTEATGGNRGLDTTWLWMHAAIDSARSRVVRSGTRGLLIDMHGHGHDVPRLELGYLLSAATLRQDNATLVASGAMARTSIAQLATSSRSTADRGVALLRGPNSLGALLVARGVPAVPSPTDPAPLVGEEYFNGGYNTERHGSLDGAALDAIQIEHHFTGVRDNATTRGVYARSLVQALLAYLALHYGWPGT